LPAVKSLHDCPLYTFVDTACLRGRQPAEIARQLCQGGSDLIQLRAKNSSPTEVRALASTLQTILQPAGVGLVVNDHWEIARDIGADFCHLGQEDFFDAGWTSVSQLKLKNTRTKIGLSTHAPAQAERALAAGADYLAIGPVFPTWSKPNARPVTVDYVRWAAVHVKTPWFAIGGINLSNVDEVLAAGAKRICVVSAILDAPDIAAACREFKRRLAAP
jgi:thiamine-phosphate pyrophosphorylase